MKYLAAYALCALSGTPAKKDVEAVLKAAGVSVDKDRLNLVFSELEGKDVQEVIKAGKGKIVLGGGGGGGAAPAAAGSSAPAAKAPEPEDEEEDDDFGMDGLF